MLNNKPRLQAVESLVPKGARLLDIGADHGLLPLSLLARDEIESALLTDVNKGPLSACRHRALVTCPNKMHRISFALSDGFEKVDRESYDFVSICGMGGELIARIIRDGGDKAKVSMALQPMSHHEKLREFLWKNGYRIKKELFPREDGRIYLVLLAEYKGTPASFTKADTYLGKKRPQTANYSGYCRVITHAAKKRLEGAVLSGNVKEQRTAQKVIAAAEKCIIY